MAFLVPNQTGAYGFYVRQQICGSCEILHTRHRAMGGGAANPWAADDTNFVPWGQFDSLFLGLGKQRPAILSLPLRVRVYFLCSIEGQPPSAICFKVNARVTR